MKTDPFMLFFLALLPLLQLVARPPVQKVFLIVEVRNIQQVKGRLEIGVFKSGSSFPQGAPATKQSVAVNAQTVRATFQIEPGDYAVALYQDVNSNGHIDKKLFGLPKEPYGFSNNIRPRFAIPKFDECKMLVREDARTMISLID